VTRPSKTLHLTLTPDERRNLLLEGIELFNRGAFFDAHERWEGVWRSDLSEPRDLLQGLIQVAAAMHQIRKVGSRLGPRGTLSKARRRLEPFAPVALGLDIGFFLEEVGGWQAWLSDPALETPPLPTVRIVDPEALA
jgi:predicted metal-dependent hydrolase